MRTIMLLVVAGMLAACGGETDSQADAANLPSIDSSIQNPRVIMETSMGNMVLEIFERRMPITSANFFSYIDASWYDQTLIHRVDDDWVIQGGGFTTGLQPKTPNADIQLETHPDIGHVHGALSMARTSDPNSADSQWFIVDWPDNGTPPQPAQLDGQYAAFGVVVEGLDVLRAITGVTTQTVGQLENVPVTEIFVTSLRRQ